MLAIISRALRFIRGFLHSEFWRHLYPSTCAEPHHYDEHFSKGNVVSADQQPQNYMDRQGGLQICNRWYNSLIIARTCRGTLLRHDSQCTVSFLFPFEAHKFDVLYVIQFRSPIFEALMVLLSNKQMSVEASQAVAIEDVEFASTGTFRKLVFAK